MFRTDLDIRLEKRVIDIYNRHNERAKNIDWNYAKYMPWDKGKSFITTPWEESQVSLPKSLVIALETSMLTELNLPWYTSHLNGTFTGSMEVIQDFIHIWTSEEDQHASALETYLTLTRNADPDKLHILKKQVIRAGWEANFETPIATMAYTSIQELGTLVFYQNVAKEAMKYDKELGVLLQRLSKDESLHYAFYSEIIRAHLEIEPNYVLHLYEVIRNFSMPGSVIDDFKERMKIIEKEANYGPSDYFDRVLQVLIKKWDIENIRPTLKEAEEARINILKYRDKLKKIIDKRR
ncbi:acyl-[acyl-carrier-protein] desaturase [Hypnocyclicus thermotrophus]|uniref:Acyl-[acyl-carrier-protein] desaturase n=1 Tax=Hypnocyclicus thermotrophus TaxID=1627895 RepID=A0AA46E002_9FUSO|nr:acyl-ACP desaturase [Hypnocyclicus thermotrophus]TDT72262.1 acyl-[acyl-carrier-protein] desaturase [Hypnocyclicus thermotrophus]